MFGKILVMLTTALVVLAPAAPAFAGDHDGKWHSPTPSHTVSASASPSPTVSPSVTPTKTTSPTPTTGAATPTPENTVQPTTTPVGDQLPVTGPNAFTIVGVGMVVLLAGAFLALAARGKRRRFTP